MLQSVRPAASAPVVTTETRSLAGPRPRSASRAGIEAMVPFILGLSPVALIVGATIGEHDARWAAWMGVWPIFSGNAHVATVRALHDAGAAVAILTGLAVNTRVAAYGFAVAARWQHQPRWFRLLAPGLLVDPTFAADEHHCRPPPGPHGATPVLPRRWSHPRRRVLGVGHDRDARGRPAGR